MSALERRLTSLGRRPERLSWTICAVIALPVLVAGLIERQIGHAESANELAGIVLYPIALGTTVSLLVRVRSPRCRPALAVLLAPVLFVGRALRHGCRGDQPGNRLALTGRRNPEPEERRRLLAR
jgi:hypothetical protein